jgi:2-dehydropantoate 2-reductase
MARHAPRLETDYLNGEIVLLGRLHHVPTPINALLQRLAAQGVRERRAPGWLSAGDLQRLLGATPRAVAGA